jgi:hypothetical protein
MNGRKGADPAANLRAALEMFGVGESMMRQRLRRDHPGASEAEIDEKLSKWLTERPGAEQGDAPGRTRNLAG